jgi:hypothetical protein
MSKYVNDKQLGFLEWYRDNFPESWYRQLVDSVIETRYIPSVDASTLNEIRQRLIKLYLKK